MLLTTKNKIGTWALYIFNLSIIETTDCFTTWQLDSERKRLKKPKVSFSIILKILYFNININHTSCGKWKTNMACNLHQLRRRSTFLLSVTDSFGAHTHVVDCRRVYNVRSYASGAQSNSCSYLLGRLWWEVWLVFISWRHCLSFNGFPTYFKPFHLMTKASKQAPVWVFFHE